MGRNHKLQCPCAHAWLCLSDCEKEKFYITGEQGVYVVTGFMELRDIDLTKNITHENRNVPAHTQDK